MGLALEWVAKLIATMLWCACLTSHLNTREFDSQRRCLALLFLPKQPLFVVVCVCVCWYLCACTRDNVCATNVSSLNIFWILHVVNYVSSNGGAGWGRGKAFMDLLSLSLYWEVWLAIGCQGTWWAVVLGTSMRLVLSSNIVMSRCVSVCFSLSLSLCVCACVCVCEWL